MIHVACAIIRKEGKILVCQRKKELARGGQWEFPGGKLEKGETAKACIVREIHEELGIDFRPEKMTEPVTYSYPDLAIKLIPIEGTTTTAIDRMTDHSAIRWVTRHELLSLPLCEADRLIAHQL